MSNIFQTARTGRELALKALVSNRLTATKKTAPDGRVYFKPARRSPLSGLHLTMDEFEPAGFDAAYGEAELQHAVPIFMSFRTHPDSYRHVN